VYWLWFHLHWLWFYLHRLWFHLLVRLYRPPEVLDKNNLPLATDALENEVSKWIPIRYNRGLVKSVQVWARQNLHGSFRWERQHLTHKLMLTQDRILLVQRREMHRESEKYPSSFRMLWNRGHFFRQATSLLGLVVWCPYVDGRQWTT
jgi:hypothetical protein